MTEQLNSDREKQIRDRFPVYSFPALLGIEIDKLEYGYARLLLPFDQKLSQGMGYLHGGVITSLCDTSVGIALFTMTEPGEKILTIELKVNFIAPADKNIYAQAKIIHKGRKTAVGEVEVTDSLGTLIAKALVTYYVYKD
jgi:uncharacterized protein (TIGR00369 family)